MAVMSFVAAPAFLAAPAFAGACPSQAKAISAKLEKSMMDMMGKDKIKDLVKKAMVQHKAGQHAQALATLAKARAAMAS